MAFNEQDQSLSGNVLPRFRLRVPAEKDEILDFLAEKAKASQDIVHLRAKQYLIYKVPSSQREYWSPELQLQPFQDYDDKNFTIIRCVVGPSQSVWMLFTFIYSAIILSMLFGGMFGLIKYQLEKDSSFLWIWPIGAFLLATFFIISKIGQSKARNQTLSMVRFLNQSLEEKWEVQRIN
jgi:hypothetical protein